MFRVAAGQPFGSRQLGRRRWGLPLLSLPAPGDGGRETWRQREREREREGEGVEQERERQRDREREHSSQTFSCQGDKEWILNMYLAANPHLNFWNYCVPWTPIQEMCSWEYILKFFIRNNPLRWAISFSRGSSDYRIQYSIHYPQYFMGRGLSDLSFKRLCWLWNKSFITRCVNSRSTSSQCAPPLPSP